jgi:hypothetical protein
MGIYSLRRKQQVWAATVSPIKGLKVTSKECKLPKKILGCVFLTDRSQTPRRMAKILFLMNKEIVIYIHIGILFSL